MEFIICAVISLISLILTVILLKKMPKDSTDKIRQENELLKNLILSENSNLKQELNSNFSGYVRTVNDSVTAFTSTIQNQMKEFTLQQHSEAERQRIQIEEMRKTLENSLRSIQESNEKKLDQMRQTVDEKLSSTLEKRLSESFSSVSKQLESVYKGLGEMQTLASSVGDLKKALTNVKVRGTWGEVSLDSLLSQILSPEQYARNVKPVPRSNNIVEFCIKLPNNEDNSITYLPIDCKFPIESYMRLVDASAAGDAKAVEDAGKNLESSIKSNARDIRDKYISPPYTTDFAIMYLPIEGLYAEVARRNGLCEFLQREYRVTVAGPTTIGAFLNSLQLGFKTLAIQKRTGEITKLLQKIRNDFVKFAELLEKAKNNLDKASNNIDLATTRYGKISNLLEKADSYGEIEPATDKLPSEDTE